MADPYAQAEIGSGLTLLGLLSLLGFAAIPALITWWMQSRLGTSIKHEYDRKLESIKREHESRGKAAIVAEFLAKWTQCQRCRHKVAKSASVGVDTLLARSTRAGYKVHVLEVAGRKRRSTSVSRGSKSFVKWG